MKNMYLPGTVEEQRNKKENSKFIRSIHINYNEKLNERTIKRANGQI